MSEPTLLSTADITADWLTDVLRRCGVLGDANVAVVETESSRPTLISHTVVLRVSYSSGARLDAPTRLFLKMTNNRLDTEWAPHVGRREVAFYRIVAPAMADPPVPRCYDAVFDDSAGRFHLLLEDLSDSHRILTEWPLPPTLEQCLQVIDVYARFHAAWWDDPRLGKGIGRLPDVDAIVDRFSTSFARFADLLGDRLSEERRGRYERVLAASARLERRHLLSKNLTMAHGDAHVWNLFYPRNGKASDIRIFDWDNWRLSISSQDLAYMMAVHWYPERRRRFEATVLRRYHETLEQCGVRGYTMDALWRDYRFAVIEQLALPVAQAVGKIPPRIWWSHLERIMLAFEDLNCDELLSES